MKVETGIEQKARALVDNMLLDDGSGRGKDQEAAARALRRQVLNRVDPLSCAVKAELDRRAKRNGFDWEGWER